MFHNTCQICSFCLSDAMLCHVLNNFLCSVLMLWSWQEQFVAKYLASLMNSIRCNMSSTSFQLFCEMVLLSVQQSDSENLLFAGHVDIPEVFHYGQFVCFVHFVFVKALVEKCESCVINTLVVLEIGH